MGDDRKDKPAPGSSSGRFRDQIAQALAGGAPLGDLVLNLTLRDASLLKRDPTVGVEDILYRDGAMHFLGVKVQTGGVATSALQVAAT